MNKRLIILLYFFVAVVLVMFLTLQFFQYQRNIFSLKTQTDISIKSDLIKIYKDFRREVNNISLAIQLGINSFYRHTSSFFFLAKGLEETRNITGLREIFFLSSDNKILLPSRKTKELGTISAKWIDFGQFTNTESFLKEVESAKRTKKTTYSLIYLPYFERELSLWKEEPFLLILIPTYKEGVYRGCGVGILNLKKVFENYLGVNTFKQKYGKFFLMVLAPENRVVYSVGETKKSLLKSPILSKLKESSILSPDKSFYLLRVRFDFCGDEVWSFVFGYPANVLKMGIQPIFFKNLVWSTAVIFLICLIFITIMIINRRNLSLISRYHYAIEHFMNPFIFINPEGQIIYANRTFKNLFDLEEDSIDALFKLQGEDSDLTKDEIKEKIRNKLFFKSIHSLRTKDKEVRYFKLMFSPIVTSKKETSFIAGDFSEITEIIRLEKRLQEYATDLEKMVEERTNQIKEREREYRQIFENQLIGIAVLNTKGNLLFYNKTFKLLSEYSDKELKNINFKELCSPTDKDMLIALFNACLDKGEVFQKEIKFFPKRKRTIFVDIFLQKTTFKGEPAVLVFIYDVTRRKMLENRLREQERIAILGEMAAGVAHDINNLFMAISGHMELALNMLDSSKEFARDHLNTSLALIKEGEAIVRRLYAYAQKQIKASELIDLNELVKDTVMLIKPIWKDITQRTGKDIKLKEEYGELKPIVGNSAEIKEVFVNLIKNAVEAMPDGGEIMIKSWMEDDRVCVMVRDTGVGIPEDIKFKIFDPYFSTKGHQGSGLGLTVSLGIVKAYGGNIKVESREGKGTTFVVYFPVAPEDVLKSRKEEKESRPFLELKTTKKVLVVEDEREVLDVIKNLIELLDVEVIGTTSPKEGIKLFEKHRQEIGLVISDLGMPEMSGFEFCKRIREKDPDVKLILLTGWGLTIEDEKREEFKINEILSKPITLETLRKILGMYLK